MTANVSQLNQALADELVELSGKIRTSVIVLAEKASNLRNEYLSSDGTSYDAKFQKFWKTYSLEKRFGSLSSFTKYANVGDFREKIGARYIQHEKQLPTSMTALYECSLLDDDELDLCLTDTWVRTEPTPDRAKWKRKGSKPRPVITPEATAASIKSWRDKWRNPKIPPTDRRRIRLAEIKIHNSIHEFKNGVSASKISLDEMNEITEALKSVMSKFDSAVVHLTLNDEKIKASYEKKQTTSAEKAKKKK
jgi:hypothetical protein